MRSLRLVSAFMRASFQEEAAHRANFFISLLTSLLNLGSGVLGLPSCSARSSPSRAGIWRPHWRCWVSTSQSVRCGACLSAQASKRSPGWTANLDRRV